MARAAACLVRGNIVVRDVNNSPRPQITTYESLKFVYFYLTILKIRNVVGHFLKTPHLS